MGRWLRRFFESQGLPVLVAGRHTPLTPQEMARLADVVLLSVPIPQVAAVVRDVAPHLRPEAALMDVTSVKTEPLATMMAHFPGEVVGTHPLFGPWREGVKGRSVVLCPGRGEKWLNWLKDLILNAGGRVKIATAQEHDRYMALVQGLTHFVLIALGATFRDLEVDLKELHDFATPTFHHILHLTQHHLGQDAVMYACIQLQNPANLPVLSGFEEMVAQLLGFVQSKDAYGLVRLLEDIRKYYLEHGEEPHGEFVE
jgi:prephenate dehydrogenase